MKMNCDCLDEKVKSLNLKRSEGEKIRLKDLVIKVGPYLVPMSGLRRRIKYCPVCGTAVEK